MADKPNDSPYNGFVRHNLGNFQRNEFLDTGVIDDGLVNNLEALYNHAFQTRVNLYYRNPITWVGNKNFGPNDSPFTFITSTTFPLTPKKYPTATMLFAQALMASDVAGESYIVLTFSQPGNILVPPWPPGDVYFVQAGTTLQAKVLTAPAGTDSCVYPVPVFGWETGLWTRTMQTKTNGQTFTNDESQMTMVQVNVFGYVPSSSSANGGTFAGLILKETPFKESP